jgi:Protein of unknown function (DUF1585)
MMKRRLGLVILPLSWVMGCVGQLGAPDGQGTGSAPKTNVVWSDEGPTTPFEPLPVGGQVSKVKYLLTGVAPTQKEIDAVKADKDGSALRSLIDGWMATPEFQAKMLLFFQNAFQQGQLSILSLEARLGFRLRGDAALLDMLLRNAQESFPRTVWNLVSQGRPLNEAMTTEQYMLTPPLKALMAASEAFHYNDNETRDGYQLSDELKGTPIAHKDAKGDPVATFVFITGTQPQITTAEFADPKSPNFLTWSSPSHDPNDPTGCGAARTSTSIASATESIFSAAYGYVIDDRSKGCKNFNGGRPMWTASDFSDWKLTTVRKPTGSEAPTRFYAVDALRKPTELVLKTPHIGFSGTVAFQSNWLSNRNNVLRVTTNQSLIVALGRSIDGEQSIFPITTPSTDEAQHADPQSACYACHKTLEPMRKFFASDISVLYRDQRSPAMTALGGEFAIDGVDKSGKGIADLSAIFAEHPRFAIAWTQKLCWFANSGACSEDDKEFQRVAEAFKASNFDFKTLVRELLSSPLVTLSSHTTTYDTRDPMVSISPRGHFCDALSSRLGLPDVCSIYSRPSGTLAVQTAKFASAVPTIGFARGAVDPVIPTEASMIPAAATEKLCIEVAERAVDATTGARYMSADDARVNTAIADMVHNLMGMPAEDPRSGEIVTALRAHFDASLKTLTATKKTGARSIALKSTFTIACQAPSLTAIGL